MIISFVEIEPNPSFLLHEMFKFHWFWHGDWSHPWPCLHLSLFLPRFLLDQVRCPGTGYVYASPPLSPPRFLFLSPPNLPMPMFNFPFPAVTNKSQLLDGATSKGMASSRPILISPIETTFLFSVSVTSKHFVLAQPRDSL